MDENDLKKLLKNKKFKTYEQHKREKKLKTIGMELGVPFAMGVGMYAIGKGIYNGINKVAKTAFPDLKDYKDYTTLQQDSRYRGTPGMYGTGLRHMGVNWLGKKYPGFHKWMVKTERKGWEFEPHETDIKTKDLEFAEYGLSKNGLVRYIQKNFTKKGKLAVQDKKLKSVEK